MKNGKYQFLILIFNLFLASGCYTIYRNSHKTEVDSNQIAINELTYLIEKDPLLFLPKVKLITEYCAHGTDSLGFGFTYEYGAYRYNDQIRFWIYAIYHNGILYSFKAEPECTIGGIAVDAYRSIFEKAGWKPTRQGFSEKYAFYEATTQPIKAGLRCESKHKDILDSLMTPFVGRIYETGPRPGRLCILFDQIAPDLTSDDLFYLLHSINPATRIIAINFIRCSGRSFSLEFNEWIDTLLNNSPPIKTRFADLILYENIKSLINCEEQKYMLPCHPWRGRKDRAGQK